MVETLLSLIKNTLSRSIIILGGPEVSYNPLELFNKHAEIDYIVCGEGELPLAHLLDNLNGNVLDFDIEGVCQRNNGNYIIKPPYISETEPPSPYCKEYFDSLKGRIAYIEASRGCPYSCAFCLSGRKDRLRYFDIERIKNEILALARSGTQTIKFVDRTFNANRERSKYILNFIKDNYNNFPNNICFHFEIAGDILDDESIDILNSMPQDLIQLEIGMQSFNEKTLSAINRRTDCKKLIKNIRRLTGVKNKHLHIDLIAGLPHEDIISFENSYNIAFILNADMLQLGFLKLLHGSAMRNNPDIFKLEFDKTAPYEVLNTAYLSPDDIQVLKGLEDSTERLYNSHRFRNTLSYLLDVTGYTPFKLLSTISEYLYPCDGLSLDEYTNRLMGILLRLPNVDSAKLRDIMVIDRLSSNSSNKLPSSLIIKDNNLKQIKNRLQQDNVTACPANYKRMLCILYSMHKIVYADYEHGDKRKHFELVYIDLNDFK